MSSRWLCWSASTVQSRLQSMMLTVTGIADLEGAEQQEALIWLREGLAWPRWR
ncbi:hypothetical protein ACFYXC_34905 [Streptomyces sp. NPDC002701]|uniref:hypothetical protein n=1 Tax=Streptomyces sp. NPDC002701 TaxID=3364661 RepID=UPI0036D1936D